MPRCSTPATSGLPALQQAEKYFTQALERDPENPRAQTGLGGYHAVMALQLRVPDPVPHLAKADAILQHVIEQHPTTSGAHLLLGLVHVARGQPEKAARSFERAIELNASCAPCYGQLGRALVRMGRPAEGLEHLHYAMRLSPRDPSMPSWLGMAGGAELELGHYDKAIEYLDRALAFDPGQPRILLVLVGAHALAGNMSEARAKLAQLQKTQPHLTGEQLVTRFFGAGGGPGAAPQRGAAAGAGAGLRHATGAVRVARRGPEGNREGHHRNRSVTVPQLRRYGRLDAGCSRDGHG